MKINYLISLALVPLIALGQNRKTLPAPSESHSNYSNVIGWKDGRTPQAPAGFKVEKYADGFDNPRWMYVLPNNDVLVVESNSNYSPLVQAGAVVIGAAKSKDVSKSADRITLLRDTNKDGLPDERHTFLTGEQGLNQPFGVLLMGKWLYVANTDALVRYPYEKGQTTITAKAERLVSLPEGKRNQHWTRNIIANSDNTKIYIAVGSSGNIAEDGIDEELNRANILEVNPDGSGLKVYAAGLRNPIGMGWAPGTKTLWTAVNERDGLGDQLVPDYLTSVKEGGFYGWPWAYWGNNIDVRVKEPKPKYVDKTIVPEVDLGPHTASIGLAFYTGTAFPQKYRGGAFIAQHGSWNSKKLTGYKVVFVPFKDGKPGKPEDFLTGFIVNPDKDEVYGRPTGIFMHHDGSLLLTDDKTNTIWRISANK
jgi:glucose/arabinose dehydrogenase